MILLDTATFLWLITGSKRLSPKAKELYLNKKKNIYLSSVSVWEMVVKYQLGRLPLPLPPVQFIPKQRFIHGIESLPLEENDIFELESLPKIHNDPFDKMLVCQARSRNLTILTSDKLIRSYPVKTEW